MSNDPIRDAEVFNAWEIAQAAGVSTGDAEALIASGAISTVDGRFVDPEQAVRAVRLLRGDLVGPAPAPPLFNPAGRRGGQSKLPLTASGVLHAAGLGLLVFTTLGVTGKAEITQPLNPKRLVFLVKPGPGGGGGGGGLRQPAAARPAALKGKSELASPVSVERPVRRPEPARPRPVRPPDVAPTPRPIEPPPPVVPPDPQPAVVAPVVAAPSDDTDARGTPDLAQPSTSQGAGDGGGAGTGKGTGVGEGTGPGIGAGSGGGTGGGPYRPGSGITPPELLSEVKPDYTEQARRRGLSGEVVLGIVVRSDGTVSQIRVLQGLGAGLDERAVEAVRRWKFAPARRQGVPVDVMVEVAVEFRLR